VTHWSGGEGVVFRASFTALRCWRVDGDGMRNAGTVFWSGSTGAGAINRGGQVSPAPLSPPWRDRGRRALASVHREVIELLRVEALRELQQLGIDIEQYRTMPL